MILGSRELVDVQNYKYVVEAIMIYLQIEIPSFSSLLVSTFRMKHENDLAEGQTQLCIYIPDYHCATCICCLTTYTFYCMVVVDPACIFCFVFCFLKKRSMVPYIFGKELNVFVGCYQSKMMIDLSTTICGPKAAACSRLVHQFNVVLQNIHYLRTSV